MASASIVSLRAAAHQRKPKKLSSRLSALARKDSVHVGSAVVIMGGWAAFANHTHGVEAAVIAAGAQGAASALVTFTLKTSLEAMARSLKGAIAYAVPPAVSCTVVLALLIAVHRFAGTRALWSTISIPYAASSAYAWIYTALLVRRRSSASAPKPRVVRHPDRRRASST